MVSNGVLHTLGGGYQANFHSFDIFPVFQNHQIIAYLLNITFMFDRCHRRSDVVTSVNFACDTKVLTGNNTKSEIFTTEKLMKLNLRALLQILRILDMACTLLIYLLY